MFPLGFALLPGVTSPSAELGQYEVFFEIAAGRAVGFAIKTLVVQAKKRYLDQAVVEQLHGLLKEMMIASGIPVGRKSHDFVPSELKSKPRCRVRIE